MVLSFVLFVPFVANLLSSRILSRLQDPQCFAGFTKIRIQL